MISSRGAAPLFYNVVVTFLDYLQNFFYFFSGSFKDDLGTFSCLGRLNQSLFAPCISSMDNSRSITGSVGRSGSKNDRRSSNGLWRNLRREDSSTSCYFAGPSDVTDIRINISRNFVFDSQLILLDAIVINVSLITPGTALSDGYDIGLGIVMIKGADFGTDVILTGLLVETLGGLSEMVIIETS